MSLKFPSIPSFVKFLGFNWQLVAGFFAVAASPLLLHFRSPLDGRIEIIIEQSIISGDSGQLIWAAALLVFLQTMLLWPYFWGALVISAKWPGLADKSLWREVVLPALIAGGIFYLDHLNKPGDWNYLAPLLTFALALILVAPIICHRYNLALAGLVLLQLTLAFFWLDKAPFLARLGFGRGDLTDAVRMAVAYLNDSQVLNFVALSLFLSFFISAVAVAWLMAVNIRRMEEAREAEHRELELRRMRFQAEEARVEREMLALVHDLKTPLMTIQGLNSLVAMTVPEGKIREYTGRISQGVDRVNEMISELLYDDVRKDISVEELIAYVRAHVVARVTTAASFRFDIAPGLPKLHVNFIRVARALINLIENAIAAINAKDSGIIEVRADRTGDGRVELVVADNGVGIGPEELERVWEYGFTTKDGSSGLGLGFVRRVVESNQGRIELLSVPGAGTTVTIIFPGVAEDDQNFGN